MEVSESLLLLPDPFFKDSREPLAEIWKNVANTQNGKIVCLPERIEKYTSFMDFVETVPKWSVYLLNFSLFWLPSYLYFLWFYQRQTYGSKRSFEELWYSSQHLSTIVLPCLHSLLSLTVAKARLTYVGSQWVKKIISLFSDDVLLYLWNLEKSIPAVLILRFFWVQLRCRKFHHIAFLYSPEYAIPISFSGFIWDNNMRPFQNGLILLLSNKKTLSKTIFCQSMSNHRDYCQPLAWKNFIYLNII